ncbi:MAG TPA: hypothetical protein V6C52_12730 [Coleofasciculaceae cyanobacterium]|jgi:hypothetical protein
MWMNPVLPKSQALRFGERKVFMDPDLLKVQAQVLDAQTIANNQGVPHYTIPLARMSGPDGKPVESVLFLTGPHVTGFDIGYPVGKGAQEADQYIRGVALGAIPLPTDKRLH